MIHMSGVFIPSNFLLFVEQEEEDPDNKEPNLNEDNQDDSGDDH